jgi:hypothetical protein
MKQPPFDDSFRDIASSNRAQLSAGPASHALRATFSALDGESARTSQRRTVAEVLMPGLLCLAGIVQVAAAIAQIVAVYATPPAAQESGRGRALLHDDLTRTGANHDLRPAPSQLASGVLIGAPTHDRDLGKLGDDARLVSVTTTRLDRQLGARDRRQLAVRVTSSVVDPDVAPTTARAKASLHQPKTNVASAGEDLGLLAD